MNQERDRSLKFHLKRINQTRLLKILTVDTIAFKHILSIINVNLLNER